MGGCFWQRKTGGFQRKSFAIAGLCYFQLAPWPALAGEAPPSGAAAIWHGDLHAAGWTLAAGLAVICLAVVVYHISQQRRWAEIETELQAELSALRARLRRSELFLGAETQTIIVFGEPEEEPEALGGFGPPGRCTGACRLLSFNAWLPSHAAQSAKAAVERLRAQGEPFRLTATSLEGQHLEIEGRPVAGHAVLRIRDVSSDRLEAARLQELHDSSIRERDALRALLNAAPYPAWIRGSDGKLAWVNAAYALAVETKDPAAAVAHGIELIESQAREASALARAAGSVWRGRAPAVVAGERRMLEIVDAPAGQGSAGMAADVSEVESMRAAFSQQTEAHARTLDQLSTAVAIFDRSKQLVFHNMAYRQLWSLDQAWLDQKPTDSEILDRLRAARLLPEQASFRDWKAELLAAYQSLDAVGEQVWFLPDGRTLRVVMNPNPQGGITYLYDDVTESYRLASQFNASMRVQSETLDALKEGVAVFGSDGRLKLFNPAFAALWALDPAELNSQPHIDQVAQLCAPLLSDGATWSALRAMIAGLPDQRVGIEQRLLRRDGSVLDCASAPLPDGATLLTFIDITASANVERLRNEFVHHVSYELRSPLTNIIGFIQFLGDPAVGPLNDKQREYAGYVMQSSTALLAIINDILDLATIDADAMELTLEEVDIAQTMQAAAEGVQDRLRESSLTLRVTAMENIGTFAADAKRIRQILFNLLSNAIGFSGPGQAIELAAARHNDEIVFSVTDEGSGIPPEILDHVFERFRTHAGKSRHRGAGLGLSIVRSFVELHGGRVDIASAPGRGTRVTCTFPAKGAK